MADPLRQLQQLRKSLKRPADRLELDDVVPVLVPASIAEEGKWVWPIVKMRVEGLAVTWACLQPEQTMLYVSHDTAAHWTSSGIDWQTRSMENLIRMSEPLATHGFQREDGSYYGVAMMHEDGIGPSRLLLNGLLEEQFPEGYLVSIPERSVGIACSMRASVEERERLEGVIRECFENGTRPFLRGLFDPNLLAMA
jgi:hypothetical protein